MCKYDEAFTEKEMLEETGLCKDCKLKCENAGKQTQCTKTMTVEEMSQYLAHRASTEENIDDKIKLAIISGALSILSKQI